LKGDWSEELLIVKGTWEYLCLRNIFAKSSELIKVVFSAISTRQLLLRPARILVG